MTPPGNQRSQLDLSGHTQPNGRPSWDDPDCPDCESEVFVAKLPSTPITGDSHECHLCGRRFDAEASGGQR